MFRQLRVHPWAEKWPVLRRSWRDALWLGICRIVAKGEGLAGRKMSLRRTSSLLTFANSSTANQQLTVC